MSEPTASMVINEKRCRIVNPSGVQPVMADIITEVRTFNGVLSFSLASAVVDGDGPPVLEIVSRVRMTASTALHLAGLLQLSATPQDDDDSCH